MLTLNNEDVSKVLDMRLCLSALDSVFQELACGDAVGMGGVTEAAKPLRRMSPKSLSIKVVNLFFAPITNSSTD